MGTILKVVGGAALAGLTFINPLAGTLIGNALFTFGVNLSFGALFNSGASEEQKGRLSTFTSSQASLPVIYGRARIGGNLIDARVDTNSDNNADLYQVIALCMGSENRLGIAEIEDIWLNEDYDSPAIANPGFANSQPAVRGIIHPDFVVTAAEANDELLEDEYLDYGAHAGRADQQTDSVLNGLFPAIWTSTARGQFISYVWMMYRYHPDIYTGIPRAQFDIKGQKVYDPRIGQWAWSENPALCILDYLTSKLYGLGAMYTQRDGGDPAISEIDEVAWISAANYCDESVTFPSPLGVQARFTCNGVIKTGASMENNMARLLSSCRGELIYEGGQFKLLIRQAGSPVSIELSEQNIIGEWSFTRAGSDRTGNIFEGTYINPERDFQVDTKVWPRPGTANGFLDSDNGMVNIKNLSFEFTNDEWRVEHLLMVMLRETRADTSVRVVCTEEALQLDYGDIVNVTHSTPGWTDKPFYVVGREFVSTFKTQVSLQEYDVNSYSLDPLNTKDSVPGTNLIDILDVEPPQNVVAVSNAATSILVQDQTRIPRILLTWDRSPHPFLDGYIVEFKHEDDPDTDYQPLPSPDKARTRLLISGVEDGLDYDIRIRAVTRYRTKSEFIVVSSTVSTTNVNAIADPLFDLDGLEVNLLPRFLTAQAIKWIQSDDISDVTEVNIRNSSNLSTLDEVLVHTFVAGADATRYFGCLLYNDLLGTAGESNIYTQTVEFIDADQSTLLPTLLARRVVPNAIDPSGREAIELLATDNGDQVAIFYRTYAINDITPPIYTRSPSGGFTSDPHTVRLEVIRPLDGQPDIVIEGYALDIDGNESYPRLKRLVDAGIQPSMTLQIIHDADDDLYYFLPESIDPDSGSYRVRLRLDVKGINAFEIPVFNDADVAEFSGSQTQSGANGGLPFGGKTLIPSSFSPSSGQELYAYGLAFPTDSTDDGAQSSSVPRSSPARTSNIRQSFEEPNSIVDVNQIFSPSNSDGGGLFAFSGYFLRTFVEVGSAVRSVTIIWDVFDEFGADIGGNTEIIEVPLGTTTFEYIIPGSGIYVDELSSLITSLTPHSVTAGGGVSGNTKILNQPSVNDTIGSITVIETDGDGAAIRHTSGALDVMTAFETPISIITGVRQLKLKDPFDFGSIGGSVVPDYNNGAAQFMALSADATIQLPSNMPVGVVLNLRVQMNGFTLSFNTSDFEGPALSFSGTDFRTIASIFNFVGTQRMVVTAAGYGT